MRRENLVQLALFLMTLLTTLAAGSFMNQGNPFRNILDLRLGASFSFTLVFILLVHELSHYFAARAHNTVTTLPYFIPAPTFIGTFGAIIKMKSPLPSRRALLDVGIAGPAASFLFSTAAVIAGLASSPVVDAAPEGSIRLGDSIIFSSLVRLIIGRMEDGSTVMLNPVAFAGWIGLLVTALNLIPAGQLDGGHVMYSVAGAKFPAVASAVIFILIGLGFFWSGWFIWAFLLLMLGLNHPPPTDNATPLDGKRIAAAAAGLVIFALTFVPVPLRH